MDQAKFDRGQVVQRTWPPFIQLNFDPDVYRKIFFGDEPLPPSADR